MATRRLINFTDVMYKWLKAESAKLEISISDLVRRIIDKERSISDR